VQIATSKKTKKRLIFFLYKNPPLLDLPQYKNLKKSKKKQLNKHASYKSCNFMLYKTSDHKKLEKPFRR